MDQLVAAKDISKMLGVHVNWIYKNVAGKTQTEVIPHYKLGSGVKFNRNEVEVWLRRQRRVGANS